MRIYSNPLEAVREVERDLWEMGIRVHPQTMQDKHVADKKEYETIELQAYGFQLNHGPWRQTTSWVRDIVEYILRNRQGGQSGITEVQQVLDYIEAEFQDRMSGRQLNPGTSFERRGNIWNEFLHDGKFSYTYSERIAPQLKAILNALIAVPNTRQAILNIHSNIQPVRPHDRRGERDITVCMQSMDLDNISGKGRIPCSMYYQLLNRPDGLQMIYTMRSCDFLTHFPVDITLALKIQEWFAKELRVACGRFTYFAGSLHAYAKDMQERGIF